jgi:hypothetical protein
VNANLEIKADWEKLEFGPPEERATFAAIGIRYKDIWLTEAEDTFVKRVRQQVHLSGYRLAEWFAWNWWRLRWEPRRKSTDWAMAHKISTVGGGYVWPNITIISDGERIVFDSQDTRCRPEEPLRYISRYTAVVPAVEFESAIDLFIDQVRGQLREEQLRNTNLEIIWSELQDERNNPVISERRKLEALLGTDPEGIADSIVDRLIADGKELGQSGMEELAADRSAERNPATSDDVKLLANSDGFDSNPRDAVRLEDKSYSSLPQHEAAWKRGVAAARALRAQENLGAEPISNGRLCQLLGVASAAAVAGVRRGTLSFELDESPTKGRVVLRSRHEAGRRFNLARLLGDRVAVTTGSRLVPATRAYTYRQKLQRSFAGEFLCPFEALADLLLGDFSVEAIEDAAAHFSVSEMTVRTLLANHGLIDREELAPDFDLLG